MANKFRRERTNVNLGGEQYAHGLNYPHVFFKQMGSLTVPLDPIRPGCGSTSHLRVPGLIRYGGDVAKQIVRSFWL